MPAKNSKKPYITNSFYHIYNRGVEKRKIFLDEQDYNVYLSYLKEYLLPKNDKELIQRLMDPTISPKEKDKILSALRINNFSDDIKLLAYCLMPNHYHLLLYQQLANGIDIFMNSLASRYARYFNKKHKRVGTLYQDVYKAVLVESDEQLLHLSRYIHRNPFSLASKGVPLQGDALKGSPYAIQPSSLPEYLGKRKTNWVSTQEILNYFSKSNPHFSYVSFTMEQDAGEVIQNIAIDI